MGSRLDIAVSTFRDIRIIEGNKISSPADFGYTSPMLRQVATIAFYTLREALHARIWVLIALIVATAVAGSLFVQQVAITDGGRIQTAFLAATLRPAAIFILSLFVIGSMVREFSDKGLELFLSLDMPRATYVLGKLAGFAGIAVPLAAALCLPLAALAPLEQVALWGASLLGELWIMAALSLFCVLAFNQIMPAAAFAAGFYLLARSIGAIQLIGRSAALNADSPVQQLAVNTVDAIAALLPRLDAFTQTAWLVNHSGDWRQLAPIAAQTLIYTALLTSGALVDLYRKNF